MHLPFIEMQSSSQSLAASSVGQFGLKFQLEVLFSRLRQKPGQKRRRNNIWIFEFFDEKYLSIISL